MGRRKQPESQGNSSCRPLIFVFSGLAIAREPIYTRDPVSARADRPAYLVGTSQIHDTKRRGGNSL